MPAVRLSPQLRLAWRMHRWLLRVSRGRIGARMGPFPVLLLTTTGRTTGRPRDVGLSFVEDDGRYYVVGSYAGEDRDPAWARNLAANQNATLSVRGRRRPAVGRVLQEPERSRMFERFVELDPAYAEYGQRTQRTIPVIELTPQD